MDLQTGALRCRQASGTPPKDAMKIERLDAWLLDFRWDEEALSFEKADKWLGRFSLWQDETDAHQNDREGSARSNAVN